MDYALAAVQPRDLGIFDGPPDYKKASAAILSTLEEHGWTLTRTPGSPEGRVRSIATELQRHGATYGTRYDGKGGVVWGDDGGLLCRCGYDMPRDPDTNGRPWLAHHEHVAQAVLAKAGEGS